MLRFLFTVLVCLALAVPSVASPALAADQNAPALSQKQQQKLRELKRDALNYAYSGKVDTALKTYDTALKIAPKDHDLWFKKAHLLLRAKKYRESAEAFDKAIENGTRMASAWHFKGYALMYNGDYEEAIKAFDEALYKLPNSQAAREGRAEAVKKLADSKS